MPIVHSNPIQMVTIAGVKTPITSIVTSHSVRQGIGTCSLRLPTTYAWVTLGADVSVQIGYASSGTRPAFKGTVTRISRAFGDQGVETQVDCDGPLARMVEGEETAIEYPHRYLGTIIKSLADMRGVKPLIMDRIKSHVDWNADANWIMLGGNKYVDDGKVVINARQGLYGWSQQKLNLFGYAIFDRPAWDARIARISGTPFRAQHTSTEGVDIFRADRAESLAQMVTYWTVEGSSYTDDAGNQITFRSIPESVPYNYMLRPKGFRPDRISDSSLSSQFLVDTVRTTREIDTSTPDDQSSWEMPGNTLIQPGDAIEITSPSLGHAAQRLWIMAVRHSYSMQGFYTTIDAWAGSGVALEHGDDALTIELGDFPVHVGDETIPWYAVPAPIGKEMSYTVSIPETYTSIAIEWWSHGCNSYFLSGASSESLVSKLIVTQNGEEIGSADLPSQPENYDRRLPYGSESPGDPAQTYKYWTFNRLPVPGKLDPGNAVITFRSGVDQRASAGAYDDFEIQGVTLKLAGAGTPILPTPRG